MPLLATVFALISTVCWSGFDLTRKRMSAHISALPSVMFLMLGQLPFFAAAAIVEPWFWPKSEFWIPAVASIILNIGANVCFLRSVSLAPFSLAIPMLSFTPVFGALMGFLILGERVSLRQMFGIALVILGAMVLQLGLKMFALKRPNQSNLSNRTNLGADSDLELAKTGPKTRLGLGLMLIVALLWSITPVFDKVGIRYAPVSLYAFLQCLGIAAVLAVVLKVQGKSFELEGLKKVRWDVLLAITVASGALGFQLLAIRDIPIGLFEALKRALGMLLALLFGYFVFREAITPNKVLGVVIMGVGIALILL